MTNDRKTDFQYHFRNGLPFFLILLLTAFITAGCFLTADLAAESFSESAGRYLEERHFRDISTESRLGIDREAVNAFLALLETADAEGFWRWSASIPAAGSAGNISVLTLTERIDTPELISGRLPAEEGECAADPGLMKMLGWTLGQKVEAVISGEGAEDLKTSEFVLVGCARHPEYLQEDQAHYLLISPASVSEELKAEIFYGVLIKLRSETAYFSDPYDEELSEAAMKVRGTADLSRSLRLAELSDRLTAEESSAASLLAAEKAKLEAAEEALRQEWNLKEQLIASDKQKLDGYLEELNKAKDKVSADEEEIAAESSAVQGDQALQLQLRDIQRVVQGDLVQADTMLNTDNLQNMRRVLNECSTEILSTFLSLDLEHESLDATIAAARSKWDSRWSSFSSSLSPATARNIERASSRTLESMGTQVSNQLQRYGEALQKAGQKDPSLQEAIAAVSDGSDPSELPSILDERIKTLKKQVEDGNTRLSELRETLKADREVLAEAEKLYNEKAAELDSFRTAYLTERMRQEESANAGRAAYAAAEAEAEAALQKSRDRLRTMEGWAWTVRDNTALSAYNDIQKTETLAKRFSLLAGIAGFVTLLALFAAVVVYVSRREARNMTEARLFRPEPRRIFRNTLFFGLGAVLIGLLLGAGAAVLLGPLFAKRAAGAYGFSVSESFSLRTILLFAGAVIVLAGAGCFWAYRETVTKNRRSQLRWIAAWGAVTAAGCLSAGCGCLLLLMRHDGAQTLASRYPALDAALVPAAAGLLLLGLLLMLLAMPKLCRLAASFREPELNVLQINGFSREERAAYLRRRLLPATLAGAAAGAVGGFFAGKWLLPLALIKRSWTVFAVWGAAALTAFFCAFIITSAVFGRAADTPLLKPER